MLHSDGDYRTTLLMLQPAVYMQTHLGFDLFPRVWFLLNFFNLSHEIII